MTLRSSITFCFLFFVSFPLLGQVEDEWIDGLPDLITGLPDLDPGRQEVGVAALDGKIYVIGGILSDRSTTGIVERFELEKNSWEEIPPLPLNTQLHHIGAAAVEGKVYSIGGLEPGTFRGSNLVFAYDPQKNAWDPVAGLLTSRGAMGVAVVDGKIYAAGGQSGGTSVHDFAVYSPSEDRWDPLQGMPTARNHLAAVAHDGLFYAVGGRAGGLFGSLEVYDPEAGDWDSLPSKNLTPRAGIAAAVVCDEIFVFGGEGNSKRGDGIFVETESYDIINQCWFSRLAMQNPRHGIGAAVVDGLIYIPGGSPVQGFGVTPMFDAFQPGTPPLALPFVRGDANADGDLDISDPVATLKYLFDDGVTLPCLDAADSDDSGDILIADPVASLNFLFLSGPVLPIPGPSEAAVDPTSDELGCKSYPAG